MTLFLNSFPFFSLQFQSKILDYDIFIHYRFKADNPDCPYIESYISPPISPFYEVNMKEGGLPYRPDQFENDINLKNSPNGAVNGFIPEDKVSKK